MMTLILPDIFSKNRSEEACEDNWDDFVAPPFLNDIGIKSQSKAIVIIGGRGCGKTTLLRYFSHATQFSTRRQKLPPEALSHIGLYWRADTNFLNAFIGGEQPPETWKAAFNHVLACDLGIEIIRSVHNLNCNPERQNEYGKVEDLDLRDVQDFDNTLGTTLIDLERSLQRSRRRLASWLNNLDTQKLPTFLPTKDFLLTLVDILKKQLPYLSDSTFAVFIDEYENLRLEQQQFINGLLKHGIPPLLFNIAMKRNGWQTQETSGPESIQSISDYREISLEEEISTNFDLFAAELLFFRLAEHRPDLLDKLPIVPDQLRAVDQIAKRYQNDEYRRQVIAAAEQLLPRVSDRAAAKEILTDERLRDKLKSRISEALQRQGSKIPPDLFINDDFPETSVVMSALLYRTRENPNALLAEFEAQKQGIVGRFEPTNDLIANNLFGCVNAIYIDAQRPSILFSGFTSLTLIAKENIRHLLELIHRIFKAYQSKDNYSDYLPVVPPDVQAKAVRDASELILGIISGHGVQGPQLYNLVRCLGSVFFEYHRTLKQSEPEINHFTLASGDITDELRMYLREAEKWSVLFCSRETKMKSTGAKDVDYIFNPIFSPYFQISFRKKRSLSISALELLEMLKGDQRTRDSLVRRMSSHRRDSNSGVQPDIFDEEEA